MANYIVALYQNFADASAAIKDLVDNGFDNSNISLVVRDRNGEYAEQINQQGNVQGRQPLTGNANQNNQNSGWLHNLMSDLGLTSVAGVGNSMTGGPISGLMKNNGDLVGALTRTGIPNQAAQQYAEGVRRGDSLVLVKTSDNNTDKAAGILNSHRPIDMNAQTQQWQQNNWQGFNPNAQPMTQEQINQDQKLVIPEMSEEMRVGKREVETGGVRIHTFETTQPEEETVKLREEHVNVERKPVDRPAKPEDLNAFKEGTVEITEHAEEPVTDKQARVVDEVVVNKDVTEHPETIKGETRSTHVEVEDLNANQTNAGMNEFEPMFRNHFQTTYSGTNANYNQYRPYYEFGYNLGAKDANQGESWDQAKQDARQQWQQKYPNMSWDQYKGAVKAGFEAAQQGQS